MRQILFLMLLISSLIFSQDFLVEKTKGKVLVQKGVEEDFALVKQGDILDGDDLIITEKNSFIQLKQDGNRFILKANSALGLEHIKRISINNLLLVLAMEEIRNVPKHEENGIEKNTAVYGENISLAGESNHPTNKLGEMKINGAKQLAENGFPESAIIVSKETFRKYPVTNSNFENRIYFAKLLENLELNNEALDEYNSISKLPLAETQKEIILNKIKTISMKNINK